MKKKYWVIREWDDTYSIGTSQPKELNEFFGYFSLNPIPLCYPPDSCVEADMCGNIFRKFFGIKKSDLKMGKCAEFEFDIKVGRIGET